MIHPLILNDSWIFMITCPWQPKRSALLYSILHGKIRCKKYWISYLSLNNNTTIIFNMIKKLHAAFFRASLLLLLISCIDKDVYQGDNGDNSSSHYVTYMYPYENEVQNV